MLLGAANVGPVARKKLGPILKHYAKLPHPFRSCVKDNVKRFGQPRANMVCAVLKDIIRGTTHWRNNKALDHGVSPGILSLDEIEETPIIDDECFAILEELDQEGKLAEILAEISMVEDEGETADETEVAAA